MRSIKLAVILTLPALLAGCSWSEFQWDTWTTLETAKFIVSLITPILVGIITFLLARYGTRLDKLKATNQELIKKRLEIFNKVSANLNDIYCYCRFVGSWQTFTPAQIITIKRAIDREIHVHKALFSVAFFKSYRAFISTVFQEYNGYGRPAMIRMSLDELETNWTEKWDTQWAVNFTDENLDWNKLEKAYDAFMAQFAIEIGVEVSGSRK